jgi:hypothetical protein
MPRRQHLGEGDAVAQASGWVEPAVDAIVEVVRLEVAQATLLVQGAEELADG